MASEDPRNEVGPWLATATEACAFVEGSGRILATSPSFGRACGCTDAPETLAEAFPLDGDALREALARLCSGASLVEELAVGPASSRQIQLVGGPPGQNGFLLRVIAAAASGTVAEDFVEQVPEGHVVIDEHLRILSWNRAAASMFGRPVDDAANLGLNEVVDPALSDLLEAAGEILRGAAGQREFTWAALGETRARENEHRETRSGTIFRMSDGPDRNPRLGVVFRLPALRHDRAALALRSIQQRFQGAFEHSPFGMALIGLDGRFLQVNEQLARILGHTPSELLRMNSLSVTHPEERDSVSEVEALILSGEIRKYDHERRCIGADGKERWVLWSVALPVGPSSRPLYAIAQVVDRTRERLEREERLHLERQLRHAQKLEAVGLLAGGIAHDFNNVLQIISSNTEILQEDLADHDLPADLHQCLDDIDGCVQRGRSLGQKLLAFGKKSELQFERVPITRVLRNLEDLLRALLRHPIELDVVVPAQSHGLVRIDVRQFEQILINLVLNARDAMPGGGTITVAADECGADSDALPPEAIQSGGSFVRVVVRDDGCGIAAEHLEHIFEPFFTTKPEGKGTGLGLAAVHGIIQQFGGFVTVDSKVDEGTTFEVLLPLLEGEETERVDTRHPRVLRGGNERILLCEDNDLVRKTASQFLKRAGYEVLETASGEEALRVAAGCTEPIDLLLTDVVMPGMTGTRLASLFGDRYPTTGIIFMTGHATRGLDGEDPAKTGHLIVKKPFYQSEILEAVRDTLDGRASDTGGGSDRIARADAQGGEQARGEGASG